MEAKKLSQALFEGSLWKTITNNYVIYDIWKTSTQLADIMEVDDYGWREAVTISSKSQNLLMDKSLDIAEELVLEGYLENLENDTYEKTSKNDDRFLQSLADVFTVDTGYVTENELDYTAIHKALYDKLLNRKNLLKHTRL